MARTISGTLSGILAAATRDIDWTLDLVFPSSTSRYATSPLTLSGFGYTNDLETVSGIRQTIEAPTDNVSVGIQNKDRTIGLDVAANWQNWRQATAVLGRVYYDAGSNGVRTGTSAWIEMFRGSVQRPNADDFQVTFDIIPDVDAAGQIVADRNLGPICPAVFKALHTCGYAGLELSCNHLLRSPRGCDGLSNSHRFMGFEHRYDASVSVPGTGGNDDPLGDIGDGGVGDCPRVDQYVRVRSVSGGVEPMMAAFVTEDYEIWNPVLRRFFPIAKVTVVRQQEIWEIVTAFGAIGYSSPTHPIIADRGDGAGTRVGKLDARDRVLCEDFELVESTAVLVRKCDHAGDVVRIEMQAERPEEKIYAYGDQPDKMIVCHNSKPVILN